MSFTKFLVWCSGANPEILDRCPTDKNKYVGLGGAVLSTAALAFVSFMFAAVSVFHMPVVLAAVGGAAWGAMIFNLDRWLISALKRRPTFWGNFAAFLPRLLLAVLLGTVISEPLVLRVFQPEVNQELVTMVEKDRANFQTTLTTDPRFAGLPAMKGRIGELNSVMSGEVDGKAVLADAEVDALVKQLAAKDAELTAADNHTVCEIKGSCGTGTFGDGPVALENKKIAARLLGERNSLQQQLDAKKAEVRDRLAATGQAARASAAQELATLKTKYAELTQEQATEASAFTSTSAASTGLLARMKALHRLGADDTTLSAAQWALRLFIIALDAMPVLVKFLMSLFPPSSYELEVDKVEADQAIANDDGRDVARELAQLQNEAPLLSARFRRDLETQQAKRNASAAVDAQGQIHDLILEMWVERQKKLIAADPDAYIVP